MCNVSVSPEFERHILVQVLHRSFARRTSSLRSLAHLIDIVADLPEPEAMVGVFRTIALLF